MRAARFSTPTRGDEVHCGRNFHHDPWCGPAGQGQGWWSCVFPKGLLDQLRHRVSLVINKPTWHVRLNSPNNPKTSIPIQRARLQRADLEMALDHRGHLSTRRVDERRQVLKAAEPIHGRMIWQSTRLADTALMCFRYPAYVSQAPCVYLWHT